LSETAANSWSVANQRFLIAASAVVREALQRHISRAEESAVASPAAEALNAASNAMPSPAALELLTKMFGLSNFERNLLMLCAAIELDSSFAALCAEAQGAPSRAFPTFSLALAALPEAHWSAMTPAAPLRRWRLIELGSGTALTTSALRIDERILHYLAGVQHLDDRLMGLVEELHEDAELVPSHRQLVHRIVASWTQAGDASLPAIQLSGTETADKRAIAAGVAKAMGSRLYALSAQVIPAAAADLDSFIRLWRREAALSNSILLLEAADIEAADGARSAATNKLIQSVNSPLIVSSVERLRGDHASVLTFDVLKPTPAEQREAWQRSLQGTPLARNGHLDHLNTIVSQFNLNVQKMRTARAEALAHAHTDSDAVWNACRMQARPRLDHLAQRIEPAAAWDDLVLPELPLQTLRAIAVHVRQRLTVYETWGFAAKGARGLGISALFAGVSGTGKTMAAEVLANELRLDLYRIDLSAVVSKYIGETEKNLRRVFDAAEEGGAILLFDEADALFGKRSEVKDSHDRYANIEVSYLLQRMEAYRGLAVLTTNLKSALDTAFLRRIRFVVQFPFPDTAQRAEIWKRIFPLQTPTENLDTAKLARLNVAGGNIRNIALNAAFLAADAGEPVRMTHMLRAAQAEYSKLEKSLTEAETSGWSKGKPS
jgi:hypothetical protein